ncbi:type IV pilin protein [Vibrio methylphosphonaticus]|uniref:type IV pilin protein n=1 Tax=Vibrio methylphosphonaticus TaxID=2946866 RepID=UPI002029D0EA|nr:type IV pilin protein [Vibrio methylphosphonaticus]MCL9776006.1 prepilin-type N-terminal cleavage/methylation domain-containing protein [Vibrio methylphosphonaticus]
MKCKVSNHFQLGLTLVEILITLIILGVLSAVAYPTYTQQTREAYRMIALGDMLEMQLELERHYSAGYHFERILSGGQCLVCESDSTRYKFTVASSAAAAYTITAIAQSSSNQTKDNCLDSDGKMSINSKGETTPNACWK